VLNTRVLSLSVFTDEDGVDVIVSSLVSLDGNTRSDVGEKGECSSECQVERDVTLSDCDMSVAQLYLEEGLLGVARGPFKATVLVLILLMALSGMTVFPSFKIGVTSTSSQTMGTLAALKIDLTDSAISAPIPDSVSILFTDCW